jgi:acetyl-CoA carboxylase carboxyltransferase component
MARTWDDYLDELRRRKAEALEQGGAEAIARLHERGKLSARERLDLLLDRASFHEIGMLAEGTVETPGRGRQTIQADGVVTGWGEVSGRKVFVVADDGSAMGGAASVRNIEKRFRIRRMAAAQGYPFVGLYEGSAIRFQDSMDAGLMSRIPAFKEVVEMAGIVPQVAAIMGPCFGRPPMDALFSELAIMVRGTGFLGWSGPTLVKGGLGQAVGLEELAGAQMHACTTGLVDMVAKDEAECLTAIRTFLSFMPSNCHELPPQGATDDDPGRPCPELLDIVPTNPRRPYDMYRVAKTLVDSGVHFEYKPEFGHGIITALARMGGRVAGLVASQPAHDGGVIDWDASFKARRFVALCDAFHIPLVFLQDQPGFLIGKEAEANRAMLWGATLIAAVQRSTVPKLTVILRKSHGAAIWAMGGRSDCDNPDLVAAWPTAIMTGTGPASAVYTIHEKELKSASDPERRRAELEQMYNDRGSVYRAAAAFGVDDVIEPQNTRSWLISALEMASGRMKRQLGRKNPLFP